MRHELLKPQVVIVAIFFLFSFALRAIVTVFLFLVVVWTYTGGRSDHLASNPHAQPPLPSDWEVRPTYPRHATVPYNLAQLWDEKFSRQAAAREQAAAEARRANALRAYSSSAGLGAGDCPSGAAKTHAAKCVRELKDARPPRGLLQDLEEEIRQFVQAWQAQRASAAAKPKTRDEDDEITSDSSDDDNGIAIESDDEEEVVFVGRKYRSSDAVGRATATATTMRAVAGTTARASVQHHRYQQYDTGSGTGWASLSSTPNKLIVHSPLDDRNASFRYVGLHPHLSLAHTASWPPPLPPVASLNPVMCALSPLSLRYHLPNLYYFLKFQRSLSPCSLICHLVWKFFLSSFLNTKRFFFLFAQRKNLGVGSSMSLPTTTAFGRGL